MSVAFRRESDEEHREPKFELPIPVGPNLVTRRGLVLIETRVAALETQIAQETDEATLADAQRSLRYWRTRQATARLAPLPTGDQVAFGSRVTFHHKGGLRSIDIVGDDEADPAAGLIAFSAPLARALIGTHPEDLVDFGGEADAIEIVATGPIEN